jgi:hypothetical protein
MGWEGLRRNAGGDTGTTSVVEDAESLIERGTRAQEVVGDLQSGRAWFEAAYREAERTGHPDDMARAALGLGGIWLHEHRTAAGAGLLQSRLEHVLGLVEPGSTLALRLRLRLAAEADYRANEHELILALVKEARADGDPLVRAEALSFAHHCLLGPDHGALRRSLAEEMVGEGARSGRRSDVLIGLLWQAVDMFLDADPHAERRLSELRGQLAGEPHLAAGFATQAIEVMLHIRAGRFDRAEQLAAECRERGHEVGDADADAWYAGQLLAIRWYQGRLAELRPLLTQLVHSPHLSAIDNSLYGALAVAAALDGDRQAATGALATLRGQDLGLLPRSSSWLVAMYGVVEASNLLDNQKAAARAYELLRPFAHLPMMASLAVACFGSTHHALGVAALTMGDPDRAVAHLREAVHRNLGLGHWPAVVHSRLRLAESLLRRARDEDAAEAAEQRRLAGELAEMLALPTPAPAAMPVPTGLAGPVSCRQQGRRWRLELGSRAVLVDHSVGLMHLAVLTANPGVEVAAIDLAAGVDALGKGSRSTGLSAQPLLDRSAVQRYRERLNQLRDEVDDLEASGDAAGAERARGERDWVLAELASGTGLGGRARSFSDNGERARLAVGKAIRRAIAHIESVDPLIGAHLRDGVHTGTRCWYRPT